MKVEKIAEINKTFFEAKAGLDIQKTPYDKKMNSLTDEYSLAHRTLTEMRLHKEIDSKEYTKRIFKLEKWFEKNKKSIEKEFLLPVKKMTQKPWWKRLLHI